MTRATDPQFRTDAILAALKLPNAEKQFRDLRTRLAEVRNTKEGA